jgi:hypothetical protein
VLNANNTHGKYGAVNENNPRKDMFTFSFFLPHTYTIINVKLLPKNCTFTNGAIIVNKLAPNASIQKKSADFPRNVPSSSIRQYRARKNMWKTKSNPKAPKKKKFVINRQIWYSRKTKFELKYTENGDMTCF